MDNMTGGPGSQFWHGYWEFSKWGVGVLGALFIIIALFLRRPGKAFAVLLLGGYASLAWYFMTVYDSLFHLDIGLAIGGVVFGALVVLTIFYYFVFIRTES